MDPSAFYIVVEYMHTGMRRIGDVLIRRNGYTPRISVPDPWYGWLSSLWTILFAIDVVLGIVGPAAALAGHPLGIPAIVLALTLLMLIQIGRHVIAEAEPTGIQVTTLEATAKRSCPDCGEELTDDPDVCAGCGWESDNPIDP